MAHALVFAMRQTEPAAFGVVPALVPADAHLLIALSRGEHRRGHQVLSRSLRLLGSGRMCTNARVCAAPAPVNGSGSRNVAEARSISPQMLA